MFEIATLANEESGWHFPTSVADACHFDSFAVEQMADKLEVDARTAWILLGALMKSDPLRAQRRAQFIARTTDERLDIDADLWTPEDEYWWQSEEGHSGELGSESGEVVGGSLSGETKLEHRRKRRRLAGQQRHEIVSRMMRNPCPVSYVETLQRQVVIMSILLFSTNQRCNPIASVMGI